MVNPAFIQTSTNAIERNQRREPRGKSRLSLRKTRRVAIVRDQKERGSRGFPGPSFFTLRPVHLLLYLLAFLDDAPLPNPWETVDSSFFDVGHRFTEDTIRKLHGYEQERHRFSIDLQFSQEESEVPPTPGQHEQIRQQRQHEILEAAMGARLGWSIDLLLAAS